MMEQDCKDTRPQSWKQWYSTKKDYYNFSNQRKLT